MKSGKMVLRPRMSTNLWQLSVPSGPIMAWSSTFRALLREIFFSLWGDKKKRKVQLKLPRDMKSFGLHYFKETAGKGKLMWQGKSQRAREQALSKIPFKEPKHDADRCSFHNCSWRQAVIFSFLFIIFISTSYFLFISFYILHIYIHTRIHIFILSQLPRKLLLYYLTNISTEQAGEPWWVHQTNTVPPQGPGFRVGNNSL